MLLPQDIHSPCVCCLEDCHANQDEQLIEQLSLTANLNDQFLILQTLFERHGADFVTSLQDQDGNRFTTRQLLEEVYIRAGESSDWNITRRAAALLDKFDINLEGAVTEILVRKIALSVSRQYSKKSTFKQPRGADEILRIIKEFNADDQRAQILTQELIINLGLIIRSRPELLLNMTLVRTGQLLQLLAGHIRHGEHCSADDALDVLMTKTPYEISQALEYVLEHYTDVQEELYQEEVMKFDNSEQDLKLPHFTSDLNPELGGANDWHHWRQINGSIGRYPDSFYEGVWDVVNQTAGLIIGDQWNPKRRLDNSLCADMTRGEKLFQAKVEHLMNKPPLPEVRRLYYEALMVLGMIMKVNPEMRTDDDMYIDVLLGHAVRLRWLSKPGNHMIAYEGERKDAWQAFYYASPDEVANAIVQAFRFLHKES
jgi:phosphorylase kinase alpha/beta subunit